MTAASDPTTNGNTNSPQTNNQPGRDLAEATENPARHRQRRLRQWRQDEEWRPTLRFTPYAWAKLLHLRDAGETEVGGFAVSAEDDLFLVEDVRLVRQRCTELSVAFDDESVADFFDEQADLGRTPERFARTWVHTHPGDSAEPSATDEDTFARAFGGASWAVMVIVAKGGETYARLRFGCSPGAELLVPVAIDWHAEFPAADHAAWQREYEQSVTAVALPRRPSRRHDPEACELAEREHESLAERDLLLPGDSPHLEDWSLDEPGTDDIDYDPDFGEYLR